MSEIIKDPNNSEFNSQWDNLAETDDVENEDFKKKFDEATKAYKEKYISELGEEQYQQEITRTIEELRENGINNIDEKLLLGWAVAYDKNQELSSSKDRKGDIVFSLMVEQELRNNGIPNTGSEILEWPSSVLLDKEGSYNELIEIAKNSDEETSTLINNAISEAQEKERHKIKKAIETYNSTQKDLFYISNSDNDRLRNTMLSAARYGLNPKIEVIDKISRDGQLELLAYKMQNLEAGNIRSEYEKYSLDEAKRMWQAVGEIKPDENDLVKNFWYEKQKADGKDYATEFYYDLNNTFEDDHTKRDASDFVKSIITDKNLETLDSIIEEGFTRKIAENAFTKGKLLVVKAILDRIPSEEKTHTEQIESKLADIYYESTEKDGYMKGPRGSAFLGFVYENKSDLLKAKSLKNFDRLPNFMHLSKDAERYLALMIDELPEDDEKVRENAKAMAEVSDDIRRGLTDELMVRTELGKYADLSEADRYILAESLASIASDLFGTGIFGKEEWVHKCEEYAAKNIDDLLKKSEHDFGYRNASEYIRRCPTDNPVSETIERFYKDMLEKYGKDDFVESTHLIAEMFSYDPEIIEGKNFPEALQDTLAQPIYGEHNIKRYAKLVRYIKDSNAEELVKCEKSLTRQLIDTIAGQPITDEIYEEASRKVAAAEEIFLKNNLPYVGKVFQTFNILSANSPAISGALQRGALGRLPEHGTRSKEAVMFADLLRAAAGSNNRSLQKYVDNLKIGRDLTEKILADGIDAKDLSSEDKSVLETYASHLEALYHNLKKGKDTPRIEADNPVEKIQKLGQLFNADERRSIPDQVIRNFAYLLGYHSLAELRNGMTYKVKEADLRNRDRLRRDDFKLEPGDLVKSTSIEYIGEILQNGCVSKEFLNGQGETDSTPLDTDVGIIPNSMKDKSFPDAIKWKNSSTAFGAMHLMMVLKGDQNSGRSRFQFENPLNRFDKTKYEIWDNSQSGGGDNYGIRVGFPSSEIDFLIYDDFGQPDSLGDLNRIKFEVARNGFFIPIVDKNGNSVFSEEEYSKLRKKMGGLKRYSSGEYNFSDLLDGGKNPEISRIMSEMPENEIENAEKRGLIVKKLAEVFTQFGLEIKEHIDGDISGGSVEVLNTGSTGRDSNVRGDGDFDFIIRLNRSDYVNQEKKREILSAIASAFDQEYSDNPRWKKVQIGDGKEVDLEISYVIKMNRVGYGTEEALKEYYDSMRRQNPEKYREVLANIIYAKQILKNAEVYGKGKHKQGGLGGAGVENWIIQNGGSFDAARKSFLDAAIDKDTGEILPFNTFCSKYAIFDFGENHYAEKIGQGTNLHDNFVVSNMTPEGYEKMVRTLSEMY